MIEPKDDGIDALNEARRKIHAAQRGDRSDAGQDIKMTHTDIRDTSMPQLDTPSLQVTDDASAAVQKTPHRISLESIKDKVKHVDYLNPERHPHMTLCLVTMENGFILVGKTTPADPANFDAELGRKFALEDALKQAWPLEAYLLRERLMILDGDAPDVD